MEFFNKYRFPLLFLVFFIVFQWLYYSSGTTIEHILVDQLTVKPSAALINLYNSDYQVIAEGSRLVSSVARINVLKGCEGTEAILMLFAAIIASFRPIKYTILGLIVGTLIIFLINQLRIFSLFLIAAHQRQWFEPVHGFIAPMIIIAVIGLFYLGWLRFVNQSTSPQQA